MKIELTKDEILRFRYYLAHEIDGFQRDIEFLEYENQMLEFLEYENQMLEFYESDNRITQRKIEKAKGLINKYSPTLDKLIEALEELENDRS